MRKLKLMKRSRPHMTACVSPEVSVGRPAAIWSLCIDLSNNFMKCIKLRSRQRRGQLTRRESPTLWHHSCAPFTFWPLTLSYKRSINKLFQAVMEKSMQDAPAVRFLAPPLFPTAVTFPIVPPRTAYEGGSLFQGRGGCD